MEVGAGDAESDRSPLHMPRSIDDQHGRLISLDERSRRHNQRIAFLLEVEGDHGIHPRREGQAGVLHIHLGQHRTRGIGDIAGVADHSAGNCCPVACT